MAATFAFARAASTCARARQPVHTNKNRALPSNLVDNVGVTLSLLEDMDNHTPSFVRFKLATQEVFVGNGFSFSRSNRVAGRGL